MMHVSVPPPQEDYDPGSLPFRPGRRGRGFEMVLAVVVMAEQAKIFEAGGSAVFPGVDVVPFTAFGRWCSRERCSAGRVPRALSRCRAGWCAAGAADVEDFGRAVHEDAGEVAVAHDPLECRGREPVVRAAFVADHLDEIGSRARVLGEVDDLGDVRPDRVRGADRTPIQRFPQQVGHASALRWLECPRVVRAEIVGEFGVRSPVRESRRIRVVEPVDREHVVECPRGVVTTAGVELFFGGGAAVAVDRVAYVPDHRTQVFRGLLARDLDQRRLTVGDLAARSGVRAVAITAACARAISPRRTRPPPRAILELARKIDQSPRHALIQVTRVAQRGSRAPVPVDAPVAGTVERGHLAQPRGFGRVELPPPLRQQFQRIEHVFDNSRKHPTNQGESRNERKISRSRQSSYACVMSTGDEAHRYRTCPLCEATCGLELHLEGDEITLVRGDQDDVFSHGFLCPKGTALKQLESDPDRLRRPQMRRGDGMARGVSWDEAFAEIERGPHADPRAARPRRGRGLPRQPERPQPRRLSSTTGC